MTKTKIGDSEWLLVDVPKGSEVFRCESDGGKLIDRLVDEQLPPGNFCNIGLATQLSESDWEGIVESVLYPMTNDIMGYENYGDRLFSCCDTATESGLSWIRSLNLDPEKVVILKIEK